MAKKWELAIEVGGAWELIGEYHSEEECVTAAKQNGPGHYGYSEDALSGHYESTLDVPAEAPPV